jgi:hypothetical protein
MGGFEGSRNFLETVEKRHLLPLPGIEPRFLDCAVHLYTSVID